MNTKYIWLLAIFLMFFTACNEEEDFIDIVEEEELPKLISGSADFSKYVALGASSTAGYTDGALFKAAQENSFPNILFEMFAKASGGAFTQPLMNDNTGAMTVGGVPAIPVIEYRLIFNDDEKVKAPQRLNEFLEEKGIPVPPIGTDAAVILGGTFNNMGVSGAKSFHLTIPSYGSLNPYFGRMATSPTATMLGDAVNQKPTFFTLSEIGGNDVLGYAMSGGTGTDQTGNLDAKTYGKDDITDPGLFKIVLSGIVSQLTANDTEGVITKIPYITSLPHFTTVPYNPLDPKKPDFGPEIPKLNAIFDVLNNIYKALGTTERSIVFSETEASAVVIKDENLIDLSVKITGILNVSPNFKVFVEKLGLPVRATPLLANLLGDIYGQSRQANKDDLLVLPSKNIIGTINKKSVTDITTKGLPEELANKFSVEGISLPLADKWVLTPEEQKEIKDAIFKYNKTITAVALEKGLALVDLNAIMTEATTGIQFDNYTLTTDLVKGGLVSLDGIHLTARGYALMANKFLEAIDKTYKSNFVASKTLAKAGDFPTNYSPTLK